MNVEWRALKQFVTQRGVNLQYVDLVDRYWVIAFDNRLKVECQIKKTSKPSAEQSDFETNYKTNANKPITDKFVQQGAPVLTSMRIQGVYFTALNNVPSTIFYWKIPQTARYLGAQIQTTYGHAGDSVKAELVDKDGVVSPAGTVLDPYVPHYCVPQSDPVSGFGVLDNLPVDTKASSPILDIFYFKFTVKTVASTLSPPNTRHIVINFKTGVDV